MKRRELVRIGVGLGLAGAVSNALDTPVTEAAAPCVTCDPDAMAKSAVKHFIPGKLTCGEAILLAGLESLGLKTKLAPDIALGLGGGVGLQGQTCGVVTSAAMILGLAVGAVEKDYKKKKMATFKAVGKFSKTFKKEYGCTNCRKLSGLDLTTVEGRKKLMASVKADRCCKLVAFGARTLAKSLQDIARNYA
jgi:C_GCAxxG_C_C family probable redox protein